MTHSIWWFNSLGERHHHPLDDVSHGFTQKLWKHPNGSNLWSCEKRNDKVVACRDKAKEKIGRRRSTKTDGWLSKKQKEAEKSILDRKNLNAFIIRAKKQPLKKEKEEENKQKEHEAKKESAADILLTLSDPQVNMSHGLSNNSDVLDLNRTVKEANKLAGTLQNIWTPKSLMRRNWRMKLMKGLSNRRRY